jgi:hypothetical protein
MDPFLAKEENVKHLQAEDELMDIKSNSRCKRFYAEHGYKRFWLVKGFFCNWGGGSLKKKVGNH